MFMKEEATEAKTVDWDALSGLMDPALAPLAKEFLSFCSEKMAVGDATLHLMRKEGMGDEAMKLMAHVVMTEMIKAYVTEHVGKN